ncbi:MAG TPA: FmdB family zinc ribbon protein [Ktedonobacterales bacterium]
MPMYDYRCKACGARFEAWQKFTDDPISVCPNCSGPAQRVIHAAGIMFKGSGFYSTDTKSHTAIPPTDAETAPAAAASSEAPKAAAESNAPKASSESAAAAPKAKSATSSAPSSAAAAQAS